MNQQQLYIYVREKCREFDAKSSNGLCDLWEYHILQVYNIALYLAEKYGADAEIVGYAALLHDIAKIIDYEKYEEIHHEVGAQMAVDLIGADLSPEKIEHVQRCIRNHRKGASEKNLSIEEICVADADAVSIILNVPDYLAWSMSTGNSVADATRAAIKKLRKCFEKTSKPTQEMFAQNYASAIRTLEGHDLYTSKNSPLR